MSNFCKLHGNTDAPCPECRLLDDELVAELRHERDEAHRCLAIAEEALTRMADVERDNDRLRALLREVAQGEPLGGTLADYIDVQFPTRVWLAVKAALEGR